MKKCWVDAKFQGQELQIKARRLAYRLSSFSLQEGNSTNVASQANVRNGVDGNEIVQAVDIRVEGRVQLLSECIVH